MDAIPRSPNHLLAALPAADFVRSHHQTMQLVQEAVLVAAGNPLTRVFFPHGGVISLVVSLTAGEKIEVAMIGNDSVFGGSAALDCIDGFHFQAIEVALQAKALKECSFPGHSDWVLDQGDDEANRLAYAIGTNRWENGEIDGDQEEFLGAIKHAIKGAPYDCPRCDRMMAKD